MGFVSGYYKENGKRHDPNPQELQLYTKLKQNPSTVEGLQTDCQRTDMTDSIKNNSNVRLGKPSIPLVTPITKITIFYRMSCCLMVTLIQLSVAGNRRGRKFLSYCVSLCKYCPLLIALFLLLIMFFSSPFHEFFLTIPCCNSFLQMSLNLNSILFLYTYKGNKHFYLQLT